MIYNERQLDSFSNPPFKYETNQIIRTKDHIQEALYTNMPNANIKESFDLDEFKYDIYLQGSYKNSTNVTKSSDVDIVVELTSVYYSDILSLNESQKSKYELQRNKSKYSFSDFKNSIQAALVKSFGNQIIQRRNKCIFFLENGGYCNADILPCFTYKKFIFFESYSDSRKNEGIEFFADSGESIINFPHQHFKSLVAKSDSTSGNFKKTVRMFKNIKDELLDRRKIAEGIAKSYFIENLLYNVSDETFTGSYRDRYVNVLDKIITDFNNGTINNYICANGAHRLISDKTWNAEALKQFLIGLIYIRDNNEF